MDDGVGEITLPRRGPNLHDKERPSGLLARVGAEMTMKKTALTIDLLCTEAKVFSGLESARAEPALFGVTDGKAIGTYLERKFKAYLQARYNFAEGNSASGIDFPDLGVDMKTTSVRQPQSSCPFKSARQKVYGLGYGLIVFVYDKADDPATRSATLRMTDTVFVEKHRTADFQMTRGLRRIVEDEGGMEDLVAFMREKGLPADGMELKSLAEEIIRNKPEQGYLTISSALQWRLQHARAIERADAAPGLRAVHKSRMVAP